MDLKERTNYKLPIAKWIYYAKRYDWWYNDIDIVLEVFGRFNSDTSVCENDFRKLIYKATCDDMPKFDRARFESEGNLELFEKLIKERHDIDVDIAMLIYYDNKRQAGNEIQEFSKCVQIFEEDHDLLKNLKRFSDIADHEAD
jgi:hypothetical protein